jgi:hypothetical protein
MTTTAVGRANSATGPVELIAKFLDVAQDLPLELFTAQPLHRPVQAKRATWSGWLSGQRTIARRPVAIGIERVTVALRLLAEPRIQLSSFDHGRDLAIARADLVALSQIAVSTHEWIPLWISVMIWGSGTSNGRGPMNTARGLADGRLDDLLEKSAGFVHDGQLDKAWSAIQPLTGSGEPFFSKWLWAASLAKPSVTPGLILDSRVRATLRRLGNPVSYGPIAYREYADILVQWSDALARRDYRNLTSEKIEYLLFARCNEPHPPSCDRCLYRWLQ